MKTQIEIRDNEKGAIYYQSHYVALNHRLLTIEEYDFIYNKIYEMIGEFNKSTQKEQQGS